MLGELYRRPGIDEAIDNVLARRFAQVMTTGPRMARIAGHLLATIGGGSDMAIDALVVATTIRFGVGIVATHNPSTCSVNHLTLTIGELVADDHGATDHIRGWRSSVSASTKCRWAGRSRVVR